MAREEQGKRPRVRIFCDYEAEGIWDYPLYADWQEGERPSPWHEITSHAPDLPILAELARWNELYSIQFSDWSRAIEQGEPEVRSEWFDPDVFTQRGRDLAVQLKRNHPDWDIVFFDEVAWTRAYAADANAPPNAHMFLVLLEESGGFILCPVDR